MWALDLLNNTILMALLPSLAALVGSTILLNLHSPMLGGVFGLGEVIYVGTTTAFTTSYIAPAARVSNTWDTKVGGMLADSLTCNVVVKSFGGGACDDARPDSVVSRWRARVRRTWLRYNATHAVQLMVLLCFRGSVIGGAILLWIAGRASPGDVTYVLTSYHVIHAYLRNVVMHINNLRRSVNDMEELVAIHDEQLSPGIRTKSCGLTKSHRARVVAFMQQALSDEMRTFQGLWKQSSGFGSSDREGRSPQRRCWPACGVCK